MDSMILRVSGQTRTAKLDKRTLLSAHPFFNALGDAVLDRLVPHARSRKVEKGAVIFQKGDPGTELFDDPRRYFRRDRLPRSWTAYR